MLHVVYKVQALLSIKGILVPLMKALACSTVYRSVAVKNLADKIATKKNVNLSLHYTANQSPTLKCICHLLLNVFSDYLLSLDS